MRTAIVEDCQEHSDLLKQYILNWGNRKKHKIVIRQFSSAEQFLFHFEEEEVPDVVFLDIQMPGLSGVELAKKLREKEQQIAIVFTTGIDDYIAEGYDLEAVHYLLKPLQEEKIGVCLDKIARKQCKESYVILNGFGETFRVKVSDIWWAEAQGHHAVLGISDSGNIKKVKIANSIGAMQERLPKSNEFVKTHRSYLVNLRHVKNIRRAEILMDDGTVIPLSRRIYKEVNEQFIRLYV